MTGAQVLAEIKRMFNDADGDRLSASEYLDVLNSAVRKVVLVRPDANAETTSVQLAAGKTRQAIPSTGFRLIDIVRNMGDDGETPGLPIVKTSRDALDTANADWHTEAGSDVIDEFVHDTRNPTVFYVTPPAHATTDVYVEMVYSAAPTPLTDASEDIPLDDVFASAIVDWALYLLYAMDDDTSDSPNKKLHHFEAFYQGLGVELQAGEAISPDYSNDGDE